MKICKACNNEFSASVIIDGKKHNLQNRLFCLVCSPYGKHNTSKCVNIPKEERQKNWKRNNSDYVLANRRRYKQKLFQYMGGKCDKCGYDKPIMAAYAFHHKNPLEKDYALSKFHRKWEIAKKEVEKCTLLCVRCHAEEHAKQHSEVVQW